MTLPAEGTTTLHINTITGISTLLLVHDGEDLKPYKKQGFRDPTVDEMKRIAKSGIKLPSNYTFVGRRKDKKGHCHLKPSGGNSHRHVKRKKIAKDAVIILLKRGKPANESFL